MPKREERQGSDPEDHARGYHHLLRRCVDSLFDSAITGIESRYHSPNMQFAAFLEVFNKKCDSEDMVLGVLGVR